MAIVPARINCNSVSGDDGPSFFKIIRGREMEELPIPPHFLKHIENEVAERATLKCPSDGLWTVVLHKNENGASLQDGWPDFARFHCLGNDEFLVFRHDGSLHFSVRIFGKNGLERLGSSVNCKHQEPDSSDEIRKQSKVDPLDLHQLELCKPEAASSGGRRKQGRPTKNKADPISLPLAEYAPEAGKDKVDHPINLHDQSESCKDAPKAASKEKRKPGRPRKNKVTDALALVIHQSEFCKHDPEASSKERRKPGRQGKKDDLLQQSKSREYAQGVKKSKKIEHSKREIKEEEMDLVIKEAETQLKVNEDEKDNRERKKKQCKIHKEHHSRKVRHTKRKFKEEEMDAIIKEADSQPGVNEEEEKYKSSRKKKQCKIHEEHHSRKVKHTKRKIKEEEMEPTIGDGDSQIEVNEDNRKRKKRKSKNHKEHDSLTMQPPTEEERARILEKADHLSLNFLVTSAS